MIPVLLISLGNEILSGNTINTNATFLSKKLTDLGFEVKKILTLPDEREMVVPELSECISRGFFRVIIITGGLGPTWDDSTAVFLSEALDTPIELNMRGLEIVTQRYNELFSKGLVDTPEITPARKKMAYLPKGAEPIFNPVGTAPGISITLEEFNTWIISLPGVPREMEAMYSILEPRLKQLQAQEHVNHYSESLTVPYQDESLLAPILAQVRTKFDVWIKSLPETYQEKKKIKLVLSYTSDQKGLAKEKVKDAKEYLFKLINQNN
ncbi:MAG: competence/damage-inducible protein A [Candidatus Hodarchaeales archaeon]